MSTETLTPSLPRTAQIKKNSQLFEVWKRFRRNKVAIVGMVILFLFLLMIIFANQIAKEGINEQKFDALLVPPNSQYIFGTDQYGRDIFSRIVHGAKYTLSMGIFAAIIGSAIGVPVGAISGYYGGNVDNAIMRVVDIIMTLPMMLTALVIAASFGGGLVNTMLAVGLSGSPAVARITRSAIMSVKNQEFVEAAKSNNASDFRIIFRYLLPNSLSPIIVHFTLATAGAILAASSLSFLGLGLQPPIPEWGALLSVGKEYMRQSWWITTIPGAFIMLAVLAVNLIGDGLRDALDPKQKR